MIDATPSATPMPARPVATVASPAAPFPPAGPQPAFVPPSVMDPVSNLDFLPVDDAFALEFRSETIEQLVGGDALRRGESERIEAGRSHTNADLVAGRDRVRVHGTLHEHTGHGLAEQAAHLHTTVDGTLDVHTGSEDTVLLAGHMRDLWDGGTAIVAAMTDDTVAGGGIRVTTPLDLSVHGLMGVEERIGTCTADTVLMESSATHYEREYGPGAHAAGLAVYTGSLYQSSRSTFRPLMRVSSGVRNLIAGGGGGGGDGDGGAGSFAAASPPPVPAQTGAATESVTGTLAAGRSALEAPATALGSADGLTGARRAPLEELVNTVDLRVSDEIGEAGTVMRAEDLPGLSRSAGTAEQLGALHNALHGEGTGAMGGAVGALRGSELDETAPVHEACALDIVPDIRPGASDPGVDASVPPLGALPPQAPPGVKLGLPGGGDPPSRKPDDLDWCFTYARLIKERRDSVMRFDSIATQAYSEAIAAIDARVVDAFLSVGGAIDDLDRRPASFTVAERAYRVLLRMGSRAEHAGDWNRADAIRGTLDEVDQLTYRTAEELAAPRFESYGMQPGSIRGYPLDPRIDAQRLGEWIQTQIDLAKRELEDAASLSDTRTTLNAQQEQNFFVRAQGALERGFDPRIDSYNWIHYHSESGDADLVVLLAPLHGRLLNAVGVELPLDFLNVAPSWAQDAYAVERALIAGRLPPGFDASRLIAQARTFERFDLVEELESGLLPTRTIDRMLERYRAAGGRERHAADIERLHAMKGSLDRALMSRFGNRAGPVWLAKVKETLSRRGLPTVPLGAEPPAGSSAPGPSGMVAVASGGRQTGETPGFGRLAWRAGEFPLSYRESLVQWVMTSEVLQETTHDELIRHYEDGISAGRVSPSAPSARTALFMHGLAKEIGRLVAAGKTSPSAAASLEDIDWGGIDTLMQLVDPPPVRVTGPPEMVRPPATAGSTSAAPTPRMDVPDPALPIVREADPTGAAEIPRLSGAYEAASQPLPLQSSSAAVRAETGAAALPPVADPPQARFGESWLEGNFDVERALLADRFPPRFNASQLINEAGRFAEFGLAEELAAGRLPVKTIDALIEGYRATNDRGRHALVIEDLHSLKESIERALRDAYPGRVRRDWLDHVWDVELPHRRRKRPAPSAASTAGPAEFDVTDVDRLRGTGEGVSHPAPLPPPTAPGRTGAGAGAPPPAVDPRRNRSPGTSGAPHPVDVAPWSAPPGPGSQVVYTETMRTPVMSTGAPPGSQGAGTPGFGRAASGAVELPFSQREAIARQVGTEDALRQAEDTFRTGRADALGWSAARWPGVLADLRWLHTIVQRDSAASAASAARIGVDWRALEALARYLEAPPPSP